MSQAYEVHEEIIDELSNEARDFRWEFDRLSNTFIGERMDIKEDGTIKKFPIQMIVEVVEEPTATNPEPCIIADISHTKAGNFAHLLQDQLVYKPRKAGHLQKQTLQIVYNIISEWQTLVENMDLLWSAVPKYTFGGERYVYGEFPY